MVAAALLGGIVAVSALGSVRGSVGPFTVTASWRVGTPGATRLLFPPLGEVEARTHRVPSRITVSLAAIDFAELRALINQAADDESEALRALYPGGRRLASLLILRLLVLAAAGGALAGAWAARSVPARLRAGWGAAGALAAASLVALLLVGTRLTYDLNAFRSPTYRGALEELPWLIRTVQGGLSEFEQLDARLRNLTRSLYDMYRRVESLEPPLLPSEADVTLLHVTDFHNHPTAAGIVVQMARAFGVDAVINTGDLTDFGTRLEAELLAELSRLDVPHFLVSGNHETPEVLGHVGLLPYIELIDGRQVEVAGVRIIGFGDPGAHSTSAQSLTPAQAGEYAAELNATLAAMAVPPHVVAVHNHRVGQAVRPGLVPLVLFGHSHTPSVRFRGGTAYVNAGTTGGAGLRGLETEPTVPITLAVIYLRREGEAVRVSAVDTVSLSPVGGGFTMERLIAPAAP